MKGIIFTLLWMSIIFIPRSFANPPTSINLTYDLQAGILHVVAMHPSFDLDKDYVRLMYVYVNGNQVVSQNYFRQGAFDKFTDDVPVSAQIGDVIKVDLFCTLGGELAQELTIAKPTPVNNAAN